MMIMMVMLDRKSWNVVITVVLSICFFYEAATISRIYHLASSTTEHAQRKPRTGSPTTTFQNDADGPFDEKVNKSSSTSIDADCWEARWMTNIPCRNAVVGSLQRVWMDRSDWYHGTQDDHNNNNKNCTLVLIKVPKSASSTVAGVVLRLERQLGCRADWQHGTALMKQTKDEQQQIALTRHKNHTTFWIAPIRTPASRALSSVYFHQISFHTPAGKNNKSSVAQPSLSYLTDHLMKVPDNFIFNYVRLDQDSNSSSSSSSSSSWHVSMRRILSSFDFLLVVDRLEESIVLMSILLNVSVPHILTPPTQNAKQAGSWYSSQNRCIRLFSPSDSTKTELQQTIFASPKWTLKHSIDQLLYDIANASLSATIQHHQAIFNARWQEYTHWKKQIETTCGTQDVFPCSFQGQQQLNVSRANCYLRDFGCGYPCIDALVQAAPAVSSSSSSFSSSLRSSSKDLIW